MTNQEKSYLRIYCKRGLTFKQIRQLVDCSDGTIRQYLKTFGTKSVIQNKLEGLRCK